MEKTTAAKREYPALLLPSEIEVEIGKAKSLFQSKYNINPEINQAANDPDLDYPLNWWDLMDHNLYRQWQDMEAAHYDTCACLAMSWQEEDYLSSPEGQRELAEQEMLNDEFEKGLARLRAYTGKESSLSTDLCICYRGFSELSDIRADVILLAAKFGYNCPFTEAEMSGVNRYTSIDKSHKGFIKYEDELYGDEFVEISDLLEWEYEDAMEHLSGFVPKGYYLGVEEDIGWGVFQDGQFDYDGPDY